MILGIIKSLLYMFIFYIFLRVSNFILKFFYALFYKKNTTQHDTESKTLNMLQCSVCNIYITKTEAHNINGKIFCKEHSPNNN